MKGTARKQILFSNFSALRTIPLSNPSLGLFLLLASSFAVLTFRVLSASGCHFLMSTKCLIPVRKLCSSKDNKAVPTGRQRWLGPRARSHRTGQTSNMSHERRRMARQPMIGLTHFPWLLTSPWTSASSTPSSRCFAPPPGKRARSCVQQGDRHGGCSNHCRSTQPRADNSPVQTAARCRRQFRPETAMEVATMQGKAATMQEWWVPPSTFMGPLQQASLVAVQRPSPLPHTAGAHGPTVGPAHGLLDPGQKVPGELLRPQVGNLLKHKNQARGDSRSEGPSVRGRSATSLAHGPWPDGVNKRAGSRQRGPWEGKLGGPDMPGTPVQWPSSAPYTLVRTGPQRSGPARVPLPGSRLRARAYAQEALTVLASSPQARCGGTWST